MSSQAVTAALAAFLDSRQARGLACSAAVSKQLAEAFLKACILDQGIAPETLDGQAAEEVVARGLPRRLPPKAAGIEQLPALLDALAAHLEESQVVTQAFEMRMGFDRGAAQAVEAVRSGSNAGEQVVERQAPVVHRAEKLGRNDPCFCGSGRKFKKCCGKPA